MKKLLFYSIFTLFALSGKSLFGQNADSFKWLVGTWEINTGKGVISESWVLVNDSTLQGKSLFIRNGKDTLSREEIELAYRNGDWYYTPTVEGQNNNRPVKFRIIYHKGVEFISENLTHDFPQRIAYIKIAPDKLFASIEGRKNGTYAKQNFSFTKAANKE